MRPAWTNWCFAACLLAITGCATQGIQQGTAFAKAGTEYSDAIAGFLDAYLVTRIDVNSKRALDVRANALEANIASELPGKLEEFDRGVLTAVNETGRLRDNVRLLRAYFENLNALATSDLPDQGGAALKGLAEAIKDANAVTGGAANTFTADQLGYIEKIGKLSVKAAVSAKVKEALQRDKDIIAWQLTWEELVLGSLVQPVRTEYERQLKDLRQKNIAGPYADPTAKLGVAWIDERRKWAQARFSVGAFETAKRAAAHMCGLWEDILTGQDSVTSIRVILADLKEFTGVIRAFDEAERKK